MNTQPLFRPSTKGSTLQQALKIMNVPLTNIGFDEDVKINTNQDGYYILNIGNEQDTGGTHWTGCVVKNNQVLYFDSFGVPAPETFEKQIPLTKNLTSLNYWYNPYQIQMIGQGRCGLYVVLFIVFMYYSQLPPLEAFKEFIKSWDYNDLKNNTQLAIKFWNNLKNFTHQ